MVLDLTVTRVLPLKFLPQLRPRNSGYIFRAWKAYEVVISFTLQILIKLLSHHIIEKVLSDGK